MTISVVIPAYNEEKYLPRTIASIAKLDRKPDELIVVDGGSTDRTADIARKLGATVMTVAHKGIGFARDKGLEKATGDIVAYTDADTVVPHDWLTKIEETLSRPGVVGVFGGFRVPDGWWVYRGYINHIQPWINQLYFFLGIPMAAGQNLAFLRKAGLVVGGFPEDYKIAEDIEMMTRLKKAGNIRMRADVIVVSSGRRGNEGFSMMTRVFKAFFLYFIFKKANKIGFPDMR
jgi:glycosyltransferase involved in cell wall biosynthesis